MPRPSPPEDTVTLSFLDLLSCALGATVLLYLVLNSSGQLPATGVGAKRGQMLEGVLTLTYVEPVISGPDRCSVILPFLQPGTFLITQNGDSGAENAYEMARNRISGTEVLAESTQAELRLTRLSVPTASNSYSRDQRDMAVFPLDPYPVRRIGDEWKIHESLGCGRPPWIRSPGNASSFHELAQSHRQHTLLWRQSGLPRRFTYRACVAEDYIWPEAVDADHFPRLEKHAEFELHLAWRGAEYTASATAEVKRSKGQVCYQLDVPSKTWTRLAP